MATSTEAIGEVETMSEDEKRESEEGEKLYEVPTETDRIPFQVAHKVGRKRLLHYKQLSDKRNPVPVLIIYAMINRYYILDLQRERSVIRRYLEGGIDVYIVDWGDPRPSDRYESIEDEIEVIDHFVDYIRNASGESQINLQGYCMGGTFATIYAALNPSKVKNLIVQAAPIDFSTRTSLINLWSEYIDADKVVDTFGNVPSSFLNSSFLMLDPVRLLADKYVKYYENMHSKDYVKNFERMEKWIFDSPDLPGEVYRQFVKELYQKNLLVKNQFMVNGERVDLKKIAMPFLNLMGSDDNLVPPESSEPLNDLISSKDKQIISFPSGHIGISVSGKAHKDLWPKIINWILVHSETKESTPAPEKHSQRAKRVVSEK